MAQLFTTTISSNLISRVNHHETAWLTTRLYCYLWSKTLQGSYLEYTSQHLRYLPVLIRQSYHVVYPHMARLTASWRTAWKTVFDCGDAAVLLFWTAHHPHLPHHSLTLASLLPLLLQSIHNILSNVGNRQTNKRYRKIASLPRR